VAASFFVNGGNPLENVSRCSNYLLNLFHRVSKPPSEKFITQYLHSCDSFFHVVKNFPANTYKFTRELPISSETFSWGFPHKHTKRQPFCNTLKNLEFKMHNQEPTDRVNKPIRCSDPKSTHARYFYSLFLTLVLHLLIINRYKTPYNQHFRKSVINSPSSSKIFITPYFAKKA
jgi:hypothetical protein